MSNKERFNIIAAYTTIVAIAAKLGLVFSEVFFGEVLNEINLYKQLNAFQGVFPVLFNASLLFCFGYVILRYYSGSNIECSLNDLNSTASNISPNNNDRKNINLRRINLVIQDYMNYTLYFIALLLVYYVVTLAFNYLILPADHSYNSTNYIVTKFLLSAKISINDSCNLISCLPLFICFRLLFYNSFPNENLESRPLRKEKKIFIYLGMLILILAFIEFFFLLSVPTAYETQSNSSYVVNSTRDLSIFLQTNKIIFIYRTIIGFIAALSLGLLISRILAMDFLYDLNIDNNKIVNGLLNIMIKMLPLYSAIQPFYGLFAYSKTIPQLQYIESFTYFLSAIGKLVYLLFIVYLCNSKEFHKFIYLSAAVKDVKKYKVYIEKI